MTASGKKKPNKVTKVRAEEVHSRPSDDDDDTTTAAPKKNELTEETKAAYFERCWKAVDDANTSGYFFEGIEDPYAFTAISSRCVTLEQVGVDGSWKVKLRTVPNHGYEDGSCEVGKQLGNYADAMNSKYARLERRWRTHRGSGTSAARRQREEATRQEILSGLRNQRR